MVRVPTGQYLLLAQQLQAELVGVAHGPAGRRFFAVVRVHVGHDVEGAVGDGAGHVGDGAHKPQGQVALVLELL